MKSVKSNQKLLLFILLVGQVILGVLTADKDFVAVFEGNQKYLWFLLLAIYYGVLLFLTILFVSFLTKLSYKIANKENYNQTKVTITSVWILIITSYTHILVLYINHFMYRGAELLLLFIIPVIGLLFTIIKDTNILGFKKIIAIIPLIIYLGFDVMTIYAVM
ncbi:hypothetical protein ACWM35_11475 [Neobacillus sp. K501]